MGKNMLNNKKINSKRRQLLAWFTPTVVALALPVHAQMSICPEGPPEMSVMVLPKCSGSPPVGSAVLELLAPGSSTITVMDITTTTGDPASTLTVNEALPRDITQSTNVTITWDGPAGAGVSCLPSTELMVTVEFQCNGGDMEMATYNVLDLLIAG